MVFNSLFNPIFNPLLKYGPAVAIIIISAIISLIVTITYKLVTDQNRIRDIKKESKSLRKKLKENRGNPEKVTEINSKMMSLSMEQMKMTWKSTIFTILPVLLIFGWLTAHLAFAPLLPGDSFDILINFQDNIHGKINIKSETLTILSNNSSEINENIALFTVKGDSGYHLAEFSVGDKQYTKRILITEKQEYEEPAKQINDNTVKRIEVQHNKLLPLGTFSIFGWSPGWLGTYFLFTIVFSIIIRKAMRVA